MQTTDGYTATCGLIGCGWYLERPTKDEAEFSAASHAYRMHRDVYYDNVCNVLVNLTGIHGALCELNQTQGDPRHDPARRDYRHPRPIASRS